MTKAVSFRDVAHVLKHISNIEVSEWDLLDPSFDSQVKPILFELGIDVRFPLKFSASNHRDLNDGTGIGFRYEGRMRRDRAWLTSKGCSVTERIQAAAYEDPSRANAMCEMLGGNIDWLEGAHYVTPEMPKSQLSKTYERDLMNIDSMYEVIKAVRGEAAVERY